MALVKRQKLSEGVIEEIISQIRTGKLEPGKKLPNQNVFAHQLGVSRTSLREALNTLENLGIVEQRQGSGTIIKSKFPAANPPPPAPPLISDAPATEDFIEAREILELGAVGLAAEKASKKLISEIGGVLDDMAIAFEKNRPSDYIEKDLAFHFLIVKASQNRILEYLFLTIRGYIEQFLHDSLHVMPSKIKRSLEFHRKIFYAIQKRDRNKAINYTKKHLHEIKEGLKYYYKTVDSKSKEANDVT